MGSPAIQRRSIAISRPRNVAARTRAEVTMTRSLTTYSPSKVSRNGNDRHTQAAAMIGIDSVMHMVAKTMSSVMRGQRPLMNPRPARISQPAAKRMNVSIGRNAGIEARMSGSAGLTPGRTFNSPSHRNSTPKPTRSTPIACGVASVAALTQAAPRTNGARLHGQQEHPCHLLRLREGCRVGSVHLHVLPAGLAPDPRVLTLRVLVGRVVLDQAADIGGGDAVGGADESNGLQPGV